MDVKYIEPLLRRAMSQPFPETLHTIIEIIKRLPIPTTGSKLPKQFANVEETIRELLKNNIFSINGAVSIQTFPAYLYIGYLWKSVYTYLLIAV